MMADYEIVTRDYYKNRLGSMSTFLTKGKNIKTALRNLVNRSSDFDMFKNNNKLRITIKVI